MAEAARTKNSAGASASQLPGGMREMRINYRELEAEG